VTLVGGVTAAATMTTRELHARLGDEELAIVDVRPLPAFNGWRLNGEARGGHVPGAAALPGAWLARLDHAELAQLLQAKGIAPGRTIVLYGDRAVDLGLLEARLAELGFADVRRYEDGWETWSSDERLPVERLPRHDRLVHPDWLRELLRGGGPEAAPAGRRLLFHVNFGVPEEYEDGHLPGALYLDTNLLESSHDWNRRSPGELDAAVRALGITHDTTVILYGRDTEGAANEKWPGRRAARSPRRAPR
jgi:thiosulfate/3-mercaptopyruvate sulfurtransferase